MEKSWEPIAGGASSLGPGYLWVEETAGPLGSLYAVAEGAPSTVHMLLKALRDDYFGERSQGGLGNALTSLRGAVEAGHTLALRHGGMAASCVVAAVQPSGALLLAYHGSCQAFLYRERDGTFESLTERRSPFEALPFTTHDSAIEQEYRQLQGGDVLLLTSGAIADALSLRELEALVQRTRSLGPQATAELVAQQAQELDPTGQATALILACQEVEATGSSPRSTRSNEASPLATPDTTERSLAAPDAVSREGARPSPPKQTSRLLSRRGRVAIGALLVIVLGFLGGWLALRTAWGAFPSSMPPVLPTPLAEPSPLVLAPLPEPSPTPSPETAPTPLLIIPPTSPVSEPTASATEQAWRRIDLLWEEGDTGNVTALQEIVALLEQLQVQTPQDSRVDEKLKVARINLSYRQKMQEIATYWGRGETSWETVASWGRIVEILEALYRTSFPDVYAKATKDKLYAAHMNYGKALEASQRFFEARGQYQRAQQIDPNRPEARDALARYR